MARHLKYSQRKDWRRWQSETSDYLLWTYFTCTYFKMLSVLPFTHTYCINVIQTKLCSLLFLPLWFYYKVNSRLKQQPHFNVVSTLKPQRCINVEITTFKYNHISTMFQRWCVTVVSTLIQCCCACSGDSVHVLLYTCIVFIYQDYYIEHLERDNVSPLPKTITNEYNATER